MSYCFIVNPTAGKGRGAKVAANLDNLLMGKIEYTILTTEYAGHGVELTQKAIDEGARYIVSVGGDGTMNEVLNGIGESNIPLGIIPVGTGNDLARTLGIPLDFEKSLEVLLNGKVISIDLGKERDNYFSIITGIGFPSDVMYHVNTTSSLFKGPLKILAGIYKTMNKLRPLPLTITTDQSTFDCEVMGVFILNCKFTGGGLRIAPEADHQDGLLDMVLMHSMSKWDFLRLVPKTYSGKHVTHPQVEIIRTSSFSVMSNEPLRKLVDGNVIGSTPLEGKIIPNGLKIIAPRGNK